MRRLLHDSLKRVIYGACIVLISSMPAPAQDEPVLIDEVVARVNSDIITLSALRRAQAELRQDLEQQGLKGKELEDAYKEAVQGLLQQLIDNQLLVQRANELAITVESQVNEFILNWGKQQGIAPAKVEEALQSAGFDPDQVRQMLRNRFMREAVLGREVYPRVFQNIFDRDVEEWYHKHAEDLNDPETVHLSEIFIGFEAKTQDQAQRLVREVIEKLHAGADFGELAERYSSRPSARHKGDIGTFVLGPKRTLGDAQAKAIEGKNPGQITDPIALADGFQILKVVERTERKTKPLDAELRRQIQMRLAQDRAEPAVKAYIESLRNDAYVWIAPQYREQQAASEGKPV